MKEEEFIKAIGDNIVLFRKRQGMKQIDLANTVGIEDSALRRIESGRTNPTAKTLLKIATALNVEVVDLVRVQRKDEYRTLQLGSPSKDVLAQRLQEYKKQKGLEWMTDEEFDNHIKNITEAPKKEKK